MINSNVWNAITDTASTQTCYICKATPKEMNHIDKVVGRPENEAAVQFGLSTLHAWIRCFECLLQVSYRLEIKKWRVHRDDDKAAVEERKRLIKERFRIQMGLLVDQPKSGGNGSINDGNTARTFFKNISLSASITGIHEQIITRFAVILQTLSCGYEVDPEEFHKYALQPQDCLFPSIHGITFQQLCIKF
jgi:hypothetical protein